MRLELALFKAEFLNMPNYEDLQQKANVTLPPGTCIIFSKTRHASKCTDSSFEKFLKSFHCKFTMRPSFPLAKRGEQVTFGRKSTQGAPGFRNPAAFPWKRSPTRKVFQNRALCPCSQCRRHMNFFALPITAENHLFPLLFSHILTLIRCIRGEFPSGNFSGFPPGDI